MNTINTIVWLFPVIFMLHDFEEIIFVEAWKRKYKRKIQTTKMKKIPFADLGITPSFSIGVLIEFFIISALSLSACIFDWYFLWLGLFFGFTIHLIVHCMLALQFKGFVPGVVTAVPLLPFCFYILWVSNKFLSFTTAQLCISCVVGAILMLLMVAVLHRCMKSFEAFIKEWEV